MFLFPSGGFAQVMSAADNAMQTSQEASLGPPAQILSLLAAAQITLQNQPSLKSQQIQIDIARGAKLVASGTFDTVTTGSATHSLIVTPLTTYDQSTSGQFAEIAADRLTQTQAAVDVSHQFRNGIQVNSSYTLARGLDNYTSSPGENTSDGAFTVVLPILRGRGRTSVARQEDAAEMEITATKLDLDQLISQLLLNTAVSYWNTLAASKRYLIALGAEKRGADYLGYVKELVRADHVARNDLHQAQANYSTRISNRVTAEQNFWAAERQLALDAGATGADVTAGLQPNEDFPAHVVDLAAGKSDLEFYSTEALKHRADYLAAMKRAAESQRLLAGAKTDLRPTLNLTAGGNYASLIQGRSPNTFFSSIGRGAATPGYSLGLNFSFPGSNETARGLVAQSAGAALQRSLSAQDLARQIRAAVAVAVGAYRNSSAQVSSAQDAVTASQQALADEQEKYKAGLSSITDVLVVEDRLNSALLDLVQAQLSNAIAIVQFRFSVGELISGTSDSTFVQQSAFISLPFTSTPAMQNGPTP
jgi:outer membrane protein TolC